MNFFGHAAIASRCEVPAGAPPGPAVTLGAMLPDFATMCRARLAPAVEPGIAAGIDLHHLTDAAFHTLPRVVALMRELDARLAHLGCARGPRRAVAHIGVELLLDGVLVDDAGHRACYVAGLGHDPAGVRWRDDGAPERFAILLARLRAHGIPADLRAPEAITARLHRILAHRPLLAPGPGDLRAIRIALAEHQRTVEVAADAVLRGTLARLADHARGARVATSASPP